MFVSEPENVFHGYDTVEPYTSMNVVYAINGEGMGHASRSSVVIHHLLKHGHRVTIFTAGKRPVSFLREKFGTVAEVTGLHVVYRENKVRRLHTAARVLMNINEIKRDVALIKRSLASCAPDVVITDFDFRGQIVASMFHVPIISIDNIQYITKAKFAVPPEDFIDYEISYAVAKMMVPRADYFFITTFTEATPKHEYAPGRVQFVPPLIRDKIIRTRPTHGDHVLVYQTSDSYTKLFSILSQVPEHFIVYNNVRAECPDNVICKDFSEDSFINDLASAKGVIVNGGFTVISESLYLRKPMLAIPIKNQFEQRLNGLLLERHGLGMVAPALTRSVLQTFLKRLDELNQATHSVVFDNMILFSRLDAILQEIAKKKLDSQIEAH